MNSASTAPTALNQSGSVALSPLSYAELKRLSHGERKWLRQGYLAPGQVNLLTSQWKSGKSTLVSVLMARLKTGGQLAGLPLAAGKAVVVTEESPARWVERGQLLDFGDHVFWFCWPFLGKPSTAEWLALIERIAELNDRHKIDLLVIDPLASLSPLRSENDATEMLNTLLPLQRPTALGISVLILHHPSKGVFVPGQAARGSGALSGFVDISIEMQRLSHHHPKDRRRRLTGHSRHDATPVAWVIELSADGTDYHGLGSSPDTTFDHGWPLLKEILEQASRSLTRPEILRLWPPTTAA